MAGQQIAPSLGNDLFGPAPTGLPPLPVLGSGARPAKGARSGQVRRPRGRHVRQLTPARVVPPIGPVPELVGTEERLVLQALRRRPVDLDAVQVAVLAGLPPSVAATTLQQLVRAGLARATLVGGRLRFGLS